MDTPGSGLSRLHGAAGTKQLESLLIAQALTPTLSLGEREFCGTVLIAD